MHKQQAREVLDRLRAQLLERLPAPSDYGDRVVKVELPELGELASAVRDYMAAEREWHALPDVPDEGEAETG